MPNAAVFQALLESLQAQLAALNKANIRLYDCENPEFFVSNIKYDHDDDKIYLEFEEE
jgi:hypothetical protein